MHPAAFTSFMKLDQETPCVFSDIFRSAESSLAAVEAGRGAQPPGFSGHNFGFSVDVAVDETLKLRKWTYDQLLNTLALHGWHCFRRDKIRGAEDWHFNYLGTDAFSSNILLGLKNGAWAVAAEAVIQRYYGDKLTLDKFQIQRCLSKLGMYRGLIDGDLGALSRQAAGAFGRAWNVPADFGVKFQRTLAYVSAELVIEDEPVG